MEVVGIREKAEIAHPFVGEQLAWTRPQWFGDKLMSCEVETADFLYSLIRLVKPQSVLETGTFKGFSTVQMATALYLNGSGTLTTVDMTDQNYVPYVLGKNGVDKHKISEEPTTVKVISEALAYLEQAAKEGKKFNLIYCDDYHNVEHVKKELEYFEKLITKPGYLLFHDSYFKAMGSIGDTVKDWAREKGFDYTRFWSARGLDMVYVREAL